jgi:hypothetical protein
MAEHAGPVERSVEDPRLLARAHEAFREVHARLIPTQRDRLDEFPPERLIAAFDAYPVGVRLTYAGPEVLEIAAELGRAEDPSWRSEYLHLVRLLLIIRRLIRGAPYRLPGPIDELLARDYSRMISEAARGDQRIFNSIMNMDIGLARGAMLPLGTQFATVAFAVAPDMLDAAGLGHVPRAPWLSLHLRQGWPVKLSRDSRAEVFINAGQFMVDNPDYQGALGVSWYTDPHVAEISPHLAYVREQNQAHGAIVIPLGTADEATVKYATSTSKTRRRLYEEGRYRPTDHAMFFLRDDLIQWATAPG